MHRSASTIPKQRPTLLVSTPLALTLATLTLVAVLAWLARAAPG